MTEDVVTVAIDDTVLNVAGTIRDESVGSAVVLDANDDVVGIVTLDDVIVRLSAERENLAGVIEFESPARAVDDDSA